MKEVFWNLVSEVGLPDEDVDVLLTFEYTVNSDKGRYAVPAVYFNEKPDIDSIRYYWRGPGFYQYYDSYEPEWSYVCKADAAIAWIEIKPYEGT